MRNFFIVFIILLGSLTLIGAGKPVAEEGIRITVTQLHNEKGHVLVSLFKDGTGYPDDANKAFRKIKLDISGKKATVLFTGLPAGNYAVSILHDENDDQKVRSGRDIRIQATRYEVRVTSCLPPTAD